VSTRVRLVPQRERLPTLAHPNITAQTANPGDMQALVAAAKQEGQLTVIALPHDWLNYGQMIDSFKSKYGLQVNELNPDAGSGDELEAIKANQGNTGPPGARRDRRRLRLRPPGQTGRTFAAVSGLRLGHNSGFAQRSGWQLVWRLLRRDVLRGEHQHCQKPSSGLERSPQVRLQGPGRAGR
jgi:hypothetical protein